MPQEGIVKSPQQWSLKEASLHRSIHPSGNLPHGDTRMLQPCPRGKIHPSKHGWINKCINFLYSEFSMIAGGLSGEVWNWSRPIWQILVRRESSQIHTQSSLLSVYLWAHVHFLSAYYKVTWCVSLVCASFNGVHSIYETFCRHFSPKNYFCVSVTHPYMSSIKDFFFLPVFLRGNRFFQKMRDTLKKTSKPSKNVNPKLSVSILFIVS